MGQILSVFNFPEQNLKWVEGEIKGSFYPMAEEDSCNVCCSPFNRLRKKGICPYCSFECCSKCIETHTLGMVDDPHCMSCKNRWSHEILESLTKKTFLNGDFYKHRKTILLNREKSYLAEYQEEAATKKKMDELFNKKAELEYDCRIESDKLDIKIVNENIKRSELQKEYYLQGKKVENEKKKMNILKHHNAPDSEINVVKAEIDELTKTYNAIGDKIKKMGKKGKVGTGYAYYYATEKDAPNIYNLRIKMRELDTQIRACWVAADRLKKGDTEKKKFVRRCTVTGCNGFLSTAWKCEMCENWSCPDCFEVKGLDRNAEHVCTADNLATAELLRRDTKPCPKCGEMISKIDGCFAKDVPILMWNGTVKMSQDICVGDELVGDDGTRRTVQDAFTGEDELYRVSQENGISYTVNSKHTLVLKQGIDSDPVEIIVDDYMQLSMMDKIGLFGYNRDNRLTAIQVESIGRGTYYGWVLDGNHRFVLEDLTCVKNCDQMWCITCHTPFSWTTGREVTGGVIHNPHYYQWLRNNGGQVPRNPLDNPCGGQIRLLYSARLIIVLNAYKEKINADSAPIMNQIIKEIADIHRKVTEIIDIAAYRFRTGNLRDEFKELAISFLLNDINEEQWESTLVRIEKNHMKMREYSDIYEAFKAASIDILNGLDVTPIPDNVVDTLTNVIIQMNNLKDMTNRSLKDVQTRYKSNMKGILIEDGWKTTR